MKRALKHSFSNGVILDVSFLKRYMQKNAWGWKLKYMILFLWIFLFSCKAHQVKQATVQTAEKRMAATSAHLWQWIQYPGL
jgi:hypothetical protein